MNHTENSQENDFILSMNEFSSKFIFYSCSIGSTCLFFGNIFNIIICLRKKLRKEMMGFYNLSISFWNIIVIILGVAFYLPPTMNFKDLQLISDFSCATLNFFFRISVQMSAWLHVFLSLDRYLCVAFNQKLAFFLNDRRKLSFVFLGLFGFICLINVPNLFFRLSLADSSSTSTPKVQCDSTPLINQIRNIVISVFRIVLPLVLQILFSTLLIYKLFKVRRSVMMNQSMEKEYRFARVILWLNLMYIITETPLLLTTFYFSLLGEIPTYPIAAKTSNTLVIMTVVYNASVLLSVYLFGSLFFVNIFTNKIFQNEIKILFGTIF